MEDCVAPQPFEVRTCKANPSLTSSASGTVNREARGRHRDRRHVVWSASLGLSDTATLSDGDSPTGTNTFSLYWPHDSTCSGDPVFTSSAMVIGNSDYTSGAYSPPAVGTYRWKVSYSGDHNNNPADRAGATRTPGPPRSSHRRRL
jgi:hypothetical protein